MLAVKVLERRPPPPRNKPARKPFRKHPPSLPSVPAPVTALSTALSDQTRGEGLAPRHGGLEGPPLLPHAAGPLDEPGHERGLVAGLAVLRVREELGGPAEVRHGVREPAALPGAGPEDVGVGAHGRPRLRVHGPPSEDGLVPLRGPQRGGRLEPRDEPGADGRRLGVVAEGEDGRGGGRGGGRGRGGRGEGDGGEEEEEGEESGEEDGVHVAA